MPEPVSLILKLFLKCQYIFVELMLRSTSEDETALPADLSAFLENLLF